MTNISSVTILYNPNSTGDGKKNAEELRDALSVRSMPVELVETQHARHAVELAKNFADKNPKGMIISSSGDGGYHEVINGVLESSNPQVVTGVLPSGNANDHYHFVHHGDIVDRIIAGDDEAIDVLKVTTPEWTYYAHSYAGLGVTPQIGHELTKNKLNIVTETWLVVTNLFKISPVKIKRVGRVLYYDHVVFSNTGRMSKYLTLSSEASVTDGEFEITRLRAGSFVQLLKHLLYSATKGVDDAPQYKSYQCTILRRTSMQLDGEVYSLAAGDNVTVESCQKTLRCIV